jgi:hypothetical protein
VAAKDLRMMIIPNTLHLESLFVSEALVPELKAKANIELAAEAVELEFDSDHNLVNRLMERKASQTHG